MTESDNFTPWIGVRCPASISGGCLQLTHGFHSCGDVCEEIPNAARLPDGSIQYCGMAVTNIEGPDGDGLEFDCVLGPGHAGGCEFPAEAM